MKPRRVEQVEMVEVGGVHTTTEGSVAGVLSRTAPPTTAIVASGPNEPPQVWALMAQALERGKEGVDALRSLIEMRREIQAEQAAAEYGAALARFQRECPPVVPDAKLAHLSRVRADGTKRAVAYATIQGLRDWMEPHLASCGFSIQFDQAIPTPGLLTAICTLTHEGGHKTSKSFTLPTQAKTPAMSQQQEYEAAYSFGCRMALRSVTGVRVAADDEEAAASVDPTTITEAQGATLTALAQEVGASMVKFLAWLKVAKVADIRAADYARAVVALENMRKKAGS